MGGDIMYFPLGIRSEYSLLTSLIKIPALIKYSKEHNITALGLLDNNLNGVMEFYDNCLANNIKPIIGLRVKINEYYIYLYARNYNGYLSLLKINTKIAFSNTLEISDLDLPDIFIVIPLKSKILYDNFKNKANVYLCYQNDTEKIECLLLTSKVLLINEVLALEPSDLPYLEYLYKIGEEDFEYSPYNALIKDATEEDIKLLNAFISNINIEIPKDKRYIPVFNPEVDSKTYLHDLAFLGLKKRLANNLTKNYIDRLEYELNTINAMGFNDYFLIVYDYVKYAKTHDILVGPGRGSAAGALVSYCLGITNIDPLKYNLLFERFLNKDRITMPDIDIDFEDVKREEMINYVKERYGKNNVAPIMTYGTLQARQVIRDVAKFTGVLPDDVDSFAKEIDSKQDLKSNLNNPVIKIKLKSNNALATTYKIAMKLEGLKRHTSTHAAGVVISSVELASKMPVIKTSTGLNTGLTMSYLEELGFLKMDFLALSNLTFIHNVLKQLPPSFKLEAIPLDDKETYELFQKANTDGVFQFETEGMRAFLKKLQPTNFNDLYAAVALFRPGPMENIDLFIRRKNGIEPIDYIDPSLKEILSETYGVIIYQEQIMQILVKMARFTFAEADNIRRAMSKKKKDVIEKEQINFINRSICNGYSKETASKVYDLILKFANYGFNKAHSVSYALIGYQMAYLKVHYKEKFLANLLNMVTSNSKKTEEYLNLAKNMGITIMTPNINYSTDVYQSKENKLLLPLCIIKGIGSNTVQEILKERSNNGLFNDYFDLVNRLYKLGVKRNIVENLINAKALDTFHINHKTMIATIDEALRYAEVASSLDLSLVEKPIIKEIPEYSEKELMDKELMLYGFYISNHPASKYQGKELVKINKIKDFLGHNVNMVILVNDIHKIKTKNNTEMAFINGSDETGKIDFVIFPSNISLLNLIKSGTLINVYGEVARRLDKYQINIKRVRGVENNE